MKDEGGEKSKEFWGKDRRTEGIKEESMERLKNHYDFYMRAPNPSILELGAAENSYLPPFVTPSRHVGVGLNPTLMKENPSLTDSVVLDLNEVDEVSKAVFIEDVLSGQILFFVKSKVPQPPHAASLPPPTPVKTSMIIH